MRARSNIMRGGLRAAVCVTALLGCSESITFPNEDALLEGFVVGIPTTNTVWVKADVAEECGKIFGTDANTRIGERLFDGSVEKRSFEDLAIGIRVRVWVVPNVTLFDSCPGRGPASAIEILFEQDLN